MILHLSLDGFFKYNLKCIQVREKIFTEHTVNEMRFWDSVPACRRRNFELETIPLHLFEH